MKSPVKNRIRLVLVDDSLVVRMGLRSLLSTEPRIEIVGEAGTVAAAVETCTHVKPAVVLLDIRLPDGTGFDAPPDPRQAARHPGAGAHVRR